MLISSYKDITMVFYIMPYKVSAYGLSDIGLVRQNNEDVWAQLPDELFFVLADGMGGHQAGEIAAKEAVRHLCLLFKQSISFDKSLEEVKQLLFETIQQVNQIIYRMGSKQEDLKGMGTTLCCLFIHPDGLVYGHVGDSRIYRLRNNQLEQLTQDHSLVRELISLGHLDEEQADDFLYKNIITKAIGTEPSVEPTIKVAPILADDLFLLCTDGLTDLVESGEIRKIMMRYPEQEIAKQLIKAAKQKGGYDNITVIVVKIQEQNDKADLSRS